MNTNKKRKSNSLASAKQAFISQQKMLEMLADAIRNNPELVSASYKKAGEQSKQASKQQS
ncbi:hypothetical protein [Vibrio campbellii]|uniref:hypothetical protein n=1 Tax=Vibrio campbellii TaxID=680 RepID=UPI004057A5EE